MFKDVLYICSGLKYTIIITLIVIWISLFLGYYIGILRYTSRSFLRSLLNIYVSIFRYTPLIFQFSITITLFLKHINLVILCILILSLNSAAYVSNIILDSLNAIHKDYWETLEGLRIPKYIGIKNLLLPTILNNAYHSLQNEIINITKESSLIGIVGVADILFRSKEISVLRYNFVMPILVVGCLYFLLNFLQERYLSNKILRFFIKVLYLI